MNKIVSDYEELGSIRAVAAKNKISECKVKKMLISNGAYKTNLSERVLNLYNQGKTIQEIAAALKITENAVNMYLPYSKGEYNSEHPSKNALKIRKTRNKKKAMM